MSPRSPRSTAGQGAIGRLSAGAARSFFDLGKRTDILDWPKVFGREAPVELEIGCGNGRFLCQAALDHPDTCYFGLERSHKYAVMAAVRLAKRNAANARAGSAEAEDFLDRLVAPRSLNAIHIYFSDPWPKQKHTKRRLFQWEFLDQLASAVKPGGRIFVKTDVDWYFADIISLFIEHPAFAMMDFGEQVEFPEEDGRMTGFESKAQRLGRRVFFFTAKARSAPEA